MELTVGGYNYETLEEPPEDCLCILCELLVRNARQTECCGRVLCEDCLEQYKKTVLTFKCPNCRSPLNGKHFKDIRTDRAVQLTMVYCVNRAEGCVWQGKLGDLHSHLNKDCNHAETKCPSCGDTMKRKRLENHQKKQCIKRYHHCPHCKVGGSFDHITTDHIQDCSQVPLPCPVQHCLQKIKRCNMNSHLEVCPKLMIPCPNQANGCIAMFKRQDLEAHLQLCPKRHDACPYCKLGGTYDFITTIHVKDCQEFRVSCENPSCKEKLRRCDMRDHHDICPKKVVKCPYKSIGCIAQVRREEMEKHEEKCVKNHLRLALNRIRMLEEKSRPTVIKLQKFSEWKKTDQTWVSEGFYSSSSGYKARLHVHANGKEEGQGTHLSVSICLIPGKNDNTVEWPFQGEIRIELLNQLDDFDHRIMKHVYDEHTRDEVKNRKFTLDESRSGYGSYKFLSLEDLENPTYSNIQYLLNDTLYFRITMKPTSQTKSWLAIEEKETNSLEDAYV